MKTASTYNQNLGSGDHLDQIETVHNSDPKPNSSSNHPEITSLDLHQSARYNIRKTMNWNIIYLENLLYRLYKTQKEAMMFLKRLAGVSQQMGIYSCGTTADIDLIRHNYFLCSAENSKKGGKQGGLLVGFFGFYSVS